LHSLSGININEMDFRKTTPSVLLIACFVFIQTAVAQKKEALINYVDPFIGTGGHGHTYPGATVPFGMVQLSPDNGTEGWDWSSGYHYSDSVISGFSHTHLSGTGIGDLLDISVMPSTGLAPDTSSIRSKFSHKDERASPGYYSVLLKDFGVQAEFTATERCGFHRYTFPKSEKAMLRIDLGFALNWDRAVDTSMKQVDDSTFVGYRFSKGWARDQRIYFAIRLRSPARSVVFFEDGRLVSSREARAEDVKVCLNYATDADQVILLKVGLSSANEQGALQSLEEITDWNFKATTKLAEEKWERELSKIKIKAQDKVVKKIFYTALYHTYLAPVLFSDRNGNYKGADGKVQHSRHPMYTIQSLWDTFRAANPLLTITQPERVTEIINSFLAFYDQHGLLPVWDLNFNETNTMTGYHAVPVVADAILKGVTGFDITKAYEAMKKSSMQTIRGTDSYREYGYLPHDKHTENVTITLEYAFDDWCIAAVAKHLGREEEYLYYAKRAYSYKNIFDASTGFFRPKLSDGKWATPFDPFRSEYGVNPYTEGNAWQHTFFVPHDVAGLAKLYGGSSALIKKLDSLFTIHSIITGKAVPDISGLIGQYAHGNEPSHHIAYMYAYLGQPWKTADWVREIMSKLYTHQPDGLCGNEDCGQMSAWYIFSALGFYPCNPVTGEYVFGSPLIDEAVISMPGQVNFKIVVKNNSQKNKYVQMVTLNKKSYSKSFITHQDMAKGGTLEITMGPLPSGTWAVSPADFPMSMPAK
jgi:predicted alpha-1,2-mannosidase